MKKLLSFKTVLLILVLALAITALAACTKTNDDEGGDTITIPDFSIQIVDGDQTYTVAKMDVAGLTPASDTRTSKDVTTYYKGFKLGDILAAKNISLSDVVSFTFADGAQKPYTSVLEAEHKDGCLLAVLASATEDDGYVPMTTPESNPDDPEGPVRAVCSVNGTIFKSVKNVARITINRAEFSPVFTLKILTGDKTYTINRYNAAPLTLSKSTYGSTYYLGYKLSDLLALNGISENGITSFKFSDDKTEPVESVAQISDLDSCIIAIASSSTQDGEYAVLSESEGPLKALGAAQPVNNVASITVTKAAQ